jgi:hypothetical protein
MKRLPILKTYTSALLGLSFLIFFFGIPFLVIALAMPGSIPFKINGHEATELTIFQLILAFIFFFGSALFVYALYLFRQTLVLFEKNKIFDDAVIQNFDRMGKSILIGFTICGSAALIYNFSDGMTEIVLDQIIKSVFIICLGLFFLVLSSVLQRAKNIKEENDLTV